MGNVHTDGDYSKPPFFVDLVGVREGKTLLVTAGMDGDEYAGIEAAKRLIEIYTDRDFAGHLIIVPLVNRAGFEAGVSHNPVDGKFPKYIFPGCPSGSDTECLIHWLASFVDESDVWLDLHGGAHDEGLFPFLWTFKTGYRSVDRLSEVIAHTASPKTHLRESVPWFSKPWKIARRGCAYIIAESGSLGERREGDITRHIEWTQACMSAIEMTLSPSSNLHPPISSPLSHITFLRSPAAGTWKLVQPIQEHMPKHTTLGVVNDHPVRIQKTGRMLWWKVGGEVHKGEVLCTIAHRTVV